jgi:hypothetical protein
VQRRRSKRPMNELPLRASSGADAARAGRFGTRMHEEQDRERASYYRRG